MRRQHAGIAESTNRLTVSATQKMSGTASRRALKSIGSTKLSEISQSDDRFPEIEPPVRQYRHVLNGDGGIDSLCLRCQSLVASAADEWLLLQHEREHICGRPL